MKTKIKNTVNWFKRLIYIVNNYDENYSMAMQKVRKNELEVADAVKIIKERTSLDADIHMKLNAPTQVVLIGRYNNRDYVQIFALRADDLRGLQRQLKNMEEYAHTSHIDAPIEYRSIVEQRW